jgi:hypothetical protein
MSRKVYAYSSINKLSEHPKFEPDISSLPQITATTKLKEAMVIIKVPRDGSIVSVQKITGMFAGAWNDEQLILLQHVNLNQVLRTLPYLERDAKLVQGFKRNKKEALNAMRLLTEAGLNPSDIVPKCVEEQYFAQVWSLLENADASFHTFRERMHSWVDRPSKLIKKLRETLPSLEGNSIILHGFYYITPIQERVFEILENAGINLIFLCHFDASFPEVNRIWLDNLTMDMGFDAFPEWICDSSFSNHGQAFAGLFERIPAKNRIQNIKIIEYASDMEFVADVERMIAEDTVIFSANTKKTKQILKEYFPENFQEKHLLAYPVGQYIYCLHSMWDLVNERLTFSMDDIEKCFASGWLFVDGLNGKDYFHDLMQISLYFKGCNTAEDWEDRLKILIQAKEISDLFEAHLDSSKLSDNKYHRIMSNPLLNLGFIACDMQQIVNIAKLINHLINTAKLLFVSNHEINLNTHFDNLRGLLSERNTAEGILDEEKIIILEIEKRLKSDDATIKCFPEDLCDAVMLIIGGGILDEDTFSVQLVRDEEFIYPIYNAEVAQILFNNKIHLCMCDEESLPGCEKSLPWPINDQMIANINCNADSTVKKYLRNMKFVTEKNALCNRYLFYCILKNENVELSWISKTGDKELASSPYIKIFMDLYMLKSNAAALHPINEDVASKILAKGEDQKVSIDKRNNPPSEVSLDLALCPKKYFYGYVLQNFPFYTSEFHCGFVLSNIIRAFACVTDKTNKEIGDNLFQLTPYLRQVECQQILDYSLGVKYKSNSEMFDEFAYSKERLPIHFLKKDIYNQAKQNWEEICAGEIIQKFHLKRPERCKEICKYCQHINYCPSALFYDDEEKINEF